MKKKTTEESIRRLEDMLVFAKAEGNHKTARALQAVIIRLKSRSIGNLKK
jgi:hypothetical protein